MADDQLRIEIDSANPMAEMKLADALTPALEELGLSTTITFEHVGDHEVVVKRSIDEVLREASRAVVNEVRVYLPPAAIALGLHRVVERVEQALRQWQRDTGNTKVDVPSWAPDNRSILKTVEREEPPKP